MEPDLKRFALSILVCGVLLLGSCNGEVASTENVTDSREQPRVIKEWMGAGYKKTDPFTIDEGSWTISWLHVPSTLKGNSLGTFQVIVYNADDPYLPVAIVAESKDKESGTGYFDEAGTFFLEINAANTRWSVKILGSEADID